MTDYGQELLFGAFLTPDAADPARVIARAQEAERAGLDLVTVQDHPYQGRFVDTLTLLGQITARTERVRVTGNVLNMALRPPAVLAKALATLDVFSGGRVEAGLGAGAFWDAIEGYGGRRLTPGQAVDALGEAIQVMRAVWGADGPGRQTVDGRYHRLSGASPGPHPLHLPEIWVGAYKPRMLRLTGAVADGWLPSIGRMSLDELRDATRRIDDAARTAGRDPAAIRRLANIAGTITPVSQGLLTGPVEQWIDELTALALEHGFSTFIVAGDDESAYRTIGEVIAPAVREAVARERGHGGTVSAPPRSAPGRGGALRRPAPADPRADLPAGIDYAAIPDDLRRMAYGPRDAGYGDVRSTYMAEGRPGLVLLPGSVQEVAAAVRFAAAQDAPLSVRSGGHGVAGSSTNVDGIVIDLSRLDAIRIVDRERRLVEVGAGATWGQVAAALAGQGWMISSGNSGAVGVGGIVTGGGIGWAVRRAGLTTDHVVRLQMVLADGSVVEADEAHHPDLFWAARGAGSAVGVVTSVVLEALEGDQVVFATFRHAPARPAEFLQEWAARVNAASDKLSPLLHMHTSAGRTAASVSAVWAGTDTEAVVVQLQHLADIGDVVDAQAQVVPYSALMPDVDAPQDGQQQARIRNGFATRIDEELARTLASLLQERAVLQIELRAVAGEGARRAAKDAFFRLDDAAIFVAVWFGPGSADEERIWSRLGSLLVGRYPAYDSRGLSDALGESGDDAERLARVAAAYDPRQVFGFATGSS